MELRPGYKQTEVGLIPKDWDAVALESLTPPERKYGIVDGPFGSNLKSIHYRKSGVPIVTSGYVTDGRFYADKYDYVDRSKFIEEKRSAVNPGDIVMAKIGERCGASAILPHSHAIGILSGNALKITVDEKRYSTEYVWQVLWNDHQAGRLKILRTVGAQPALSITNLKRYKIPVARTRREQRVIATALGDVDVLLDGLDRLIAKKRALKQAAMQQLLTGQTRLPGFRGEWEVKRLGDAVKVQKGQLITAKNIAPGLVPVVAGGKEPAYYHSTANRAGKTITISASGANAGFVNLFSEPIFASDCSTISEGAGYSIIFVYFLMCFHQTWIYQAQTGGAQPHVHPSDLAQLECAFPHYPEQTAIATVLSEMDAEIAALEARRAKTRDLKQAMMQELLTGRTRLVKPGLSEGL